MALLDQAKQLWRAGIVLILLLHRRKVLYLYKEFVSGKESQKRKLDSRNEWQVL